MSPGANAGTLVVAGLDEPHRDGLNLVWSAALERREADGQIPAALALHAGFAFEPPLAALDGPFAFTGGRGAGQSPARVRAFGLWQTPAEPDPLWQERSRQVLVHTPTAAEAVEMQDRYQEIEASAAAVGEGREPLAGVPVPYPGFVVELLAAAGSERLFLASVPPGATLRATLELALRGCRPGVADRLEPGERLIVPALHFRFVAEVRGPHRGHVVSVDGAFDLADGGDPRPSRPRSTGHLLPPRELVCKGPFLVWCCPAGSLAPTTVLWIENTEPCVPWAP